jgi:hypothetical protein
MPKKAIPLSVAVMAAVDVEQGHDTGKKIRKEAGAGYGRGSIARAAETHGVSDEMARKLRALATPDDGYTDREIKAIAKRIRKGEARITITHLIKLLGVPRGTLRDSLLEKAFKESWSSHRLQKEIIAAIPRKRAAGRRPHIVTGERFRPELERQCWAWNRWLTLSLEANPPLRGTLGKHVASLQTSLNQILAALEPDQEG